jgi:hypothetical protein
MPDVQEVFRMATQKVRPDPGALERQQIQQRRRITRRRAGAYALVAALVAAIAVVALRAAVGPSKPTDVGTQPSSPSPILGTGQPVGTVTSDGTTCSIEMTGQRIEAGFVVFEAVNDTDEQAMFDSWVLSEGFTFQSFERAVHRDASLAEEGKAQGAWPGDDEVTYLRSDVVPAHSSDTIAVPMAAGRHAITCLKPYDGLGLRPYGIAGPITVP